MFEYVFKLKSLNKSCKSLHPTYFLGVVCRLKKLGILLQIIIYIMLNVFLKKIGREKMDKKA